MKIIFVLSLLGLGICLSAQANVNTLSEEDRCEIISNLLDLALDYNILPTANHFSQAAKKAKTPLEIPLILETADDCLLEVNKSFDFFRFHPMSLEELKRIRENEKKSEIRYDLVLQIADFTANQDVVEVTLMHNVYLVGESYIMVSFRKIEDVWFYKLITARPLN